MRFFSVGDCEFLSVGKDEFNQVLRQSWEESWALRINFLKKSPFFIDWTPDQIRNTADMSQLKEYRSNVVIYNINCFVLGFM